MEEKTKVSCLQCGATNNYPRKGIRGKKVVCGRCQHPLPKPGSVVEPLPGEAYSLFQNSAIPILVEFFTKSCPHCQQMHPVIKNLAKRRAGELMAIKVNLEKHAELGASFGVMGVPTFIVLHKGQERGRTSGAMTEADFALWLANRV